MVVGASNPLIACSPASPTARSIRSPARRAFPTSENTLPWMVFPALAIIPVGVNSGSMPPMTSPVNCAASESGYMRLATPPPTPAEAPRAVSDKVVAIGACLNFAPRLAIRSCEKARIGPAAAGALLTKPAIGPPPNVSPKVIPAMFPALPAIDTGSPGSKDFATSSGVGIPVTLENIFPYVISLPVTVLTSPSGVTLLMKLSAPLTVPATISTSDETNCSPKLTSGPRLRRVSSANLPGAGDASVACLGSSTKPSGSVFFWGSGTAPSGFFGSSTNPSGRTAFTGLASPTCRF